MVTRAEWIAALRSGKYKQGKSRLKRGDAFCCLGVACDIKGSCSWITEHGIEYFGPSGYSLSYEMLDELQIDNKIQDHLIFMNDMEERSFTEIADYLEGQLERTTS